MRQEIMRQTGVELLVDTVSEIWTLAGTDGTIPPSTNETPENYAIGMLSPRYPQSVVALGGL
jgi:hypothetical protein